VPEGVRLPRCFRPISYLVVVCVGLKLTSSKMEAKALHAVVDVAVVVVDVDVAAVVVVVDDAVLEGRAEELLRVCAVVVVHGGAYWEFLEVWDDGECCEGVDQARRRG